MSDTSISLPEFERIEGGGRVALVHPEYLPEIEAALLDDSGVQPAGVEGRDELYRCETPRGNVLVRRYRRGGFVGRFIRESFVVRNRPRAELRVHRAAYLAGVPTCMPVGAMWERRGLLVRGAYATLELDGVDLLAKLQQPGSAHEEVVQSCGRSIRRMHGAGILHADLQIKNLFVGDGGVFILDFDRARSSVTVTPRMVEANFDRLRRSFVKRGVSLAYFDAIRAAYEA